MFAKTKIDKISVIIANLSVAITEFCFYSVGLNYLIKVSKALFAYYTIQCLLGYVYVVCQVVQQTIVAVCNSSSICTMRCTPTGIAFIRQWQHRFSWFLAFVCFGHVYESKAIILYVIRSNRRFFCFFVCFSFMLEQSGVNNEFNISRFLMTCVVKLLRKKCFLTHLILSN